MRALQNTPRDVSDTRPDPSFADLTPEGRALMARALDVSADLVAQSMLTSGVFHELRLSAMRQRAAHDALVVRDLRCTLRGAR